jgi:hypothetical protein
VVRDCLLVVGSGALRLIIPGQFPNLDIGRGELASADTPLKEQVELGKGASGRLRNAEVGVDGTVGWLIAEYKNNGGRLTKEQLHQPRTTRCTAGDSMRRGSTCKE